MTHQRLIQFADTPSASTSARKPSYRLLAVPPALLSLLTSSDSYSSAPLEIRGDASDSAVLVTPTQTYTLRGVQNSNSLCVCSSGNDGGSGGKWFGTGAGVAGGGAMSADRDEGDRRPSKRKRETIEIETVLHETLEAVPGVARTEKLEGLLKGCEYRGEVAEEEAPPTRRITLDTLRSRLPASDAEILAALAKHRTVTLSASLRPVPASFRLQILPSLLATLPLPAALAHPGKAKKPKSKAAAAKGKEPMYAEADEQDLLEALDAVDCGQVVAREVVRWFGDKVDGGKERWKIAVEKVVKEVGIVLLADGGFGQQALDLFIAKWRELCGGFAPVCDLSLLAGIHLVHSAPLSTIQYLPSSSLSPDPATRFAELFALSPRWLESDMGLFIDDLTGGDKKKRDALVLKFVRKVKDQGKAGGGTEATWWTPRNLWT
ncbi:hypothetical protein JCM21900_000543 [Sporobolomyces salmonicolor]